ncbi:MAG TPA: hypothetical protein VGG02_13825 [Chthoniobacterales bacterium]|jgi:TM2 domain-containing membrane protein YozV
MSAEYFYDDGKGANGPFSLLEMLALKDRFVIRADTKVRRNNGDWKQAAEFHEFSTSIVPAAAPARPEQSNGVATLLSIVFPGGGQLYQDRIGTGLALFFATAFGYVCLIVPGLILHVMGVIDAATWKGSAVAKPGVRKPGKYVYWDELPDGTMVPKGRFDEAKAPPLQEK